MKIYSLKEMNEKLLNKNGQIQNIEEDTKIVKLPMKDDHHLANSRFHQINK